MARMGSNGSGRRVRRQFTEEFKAGAVRLVLDEGKTVGAVARELDLTASALSLWVRQARADRTKGKSGLMKEEREEPGRRPVRRAARSPLRAAGSASCLLSAREGISGCGRSRRRWPGLSFQNRQRPPELCLPQGPGRATAPSPRGASRRDRAAGRAHTAPRQPSALACAENRSVAMRVLPLAPHMPGRCGPLRGGPLDTQGMSRWGVFY